MDANLRLKDLKILWIESEDRGHPNISEFSECHFGSYEFEDDSVERRPQVLLLLDIEKMPKTESVEEIIEFLDKLDLSMMSLMPDVERELEGPLGSRKVVAMNENSFLTDLGWTWRDLALKMYGMRSSLQRRPYKRMIEVIGGWGGDVDEMIKQDG